MGDGLYYVRSGDEHVRSFVDHDDEVGNRGRINCTAGAWSHDCRNLRNYPAIKGIAKKDVGITCQRHDTLLNAGSAGIVEADHWRSHFGGEVHDFDNLGGIGLGQRTAKHGEILGKDEYQTPFDAAVSGDEAIAVDLLLCHSEVVAAVRYQFVGFFKRALVEQKLNALASRHFAFFMLAFAPLLASAVFGKTIALFQFSKFFFNSHGGRIIAGWKVGNGVSGGMSSLTAGRPSAAELLFHAGAERLVFISFAVPEDHGRHLIASVFFSEDSHNFFVFLYGQLLHHDLFEGQIHNNEFCLRSSGAPGFGASSVNYEQRKAAPFRIFSGKLSGDFGIAVSKEAVIRIDDDKTVFGLIHHRIGAARGDHNVLDAIAVQISL